MQKPLTLTEIKALGKGQYSFATLTKILEKRGVSRNVSAVDIMALYKTAKPPKVYDTTFLDLAEKQYPNITLQELTDNQEKYLFYIWLPLALSQLVAIIGTSKGLSSSQSNILASWGLSRLATVLDVPHMDNKSALRFIRRFDPAYKKKKE